MVFPGGSHLPVYPESGTVASQTAAQLMTISRTHTLSSLALSSLFLALTSVSCGSEKDQGEQGETAEDATDTDINVPDTGDGDGSVITGDYEESDGGTAELTDDQVERILNSECVGAEAEGERLPAALEMVIDVSGSMNKTVHGEEPEAGQQSKWDITKVALLAAVGELPSSVSFGAIYYPNKQATVNPPSAPGPVSDCVNVEAGLPIASLGQQDSTQRTAFQANIDSVYVDNYTPTHDAYSYGLNEQLLPFGGTNRFIVLITDGAPTINEGCRWDANETSGDEPKTLPAVVSTGDGSFDAETAPIIASIQEAREKYGVHTYIIGSPGSEQSVESETDMRPWLSAAAQAGGTAGADCSNEGPNYCHFDMSDPESDFAQQLKSTLASIAGEVANVCTFLIPDPPHGEDLDPNKTHVLVEWGDDTNELVRPDAIGECQGDGWRYNEAEQTVEMCGTTCDRIKTDPKAVVHVSFGCEDIDLLYR